MSRTRVKTCSPPWTGLRTAGSSLPYPLTLASNTHRGTLSATHPYVALRLPSLGHYFPSTPVEWRRPPRHLKSSTSAHSSRTPPTRSLKPATQRARQAGNDDDLDSVSDGVKVIVVAVLACTLRCCSGSLRLPKGFLLLSRDKKGSCPYRTAVTISIL